MSYEQERMEIPLRSDALPEGVLYKDTGCHLHPSCLSCPRAICIYDSDRRVARGDGTHEKVMVLHHEGRRPMDIASALGVSRRTVFRHLALTRGRPVGAA